ncbi:MAG: GNAT family N-acetyltransferase [Prevotellaceae bacterium]|jgi:RimJ/RimL family protein N-acetyltransferase|nr:GNAT family N-acetyltransferase [Prevotellaceae bacterium]
MKLDFKHSEESDIPFYAALLRNKEWLSIGGFSYSDFETNSHIANYIKCRNKEDMKFVILLRRTSEKIAFCHFKKITDDSVEYFGGVRYDLINKGYGIHAAIQSIDYFYKTHSISRIKAVVLHTNYKSIRLDRAIGFIDICEKYINGKRYIVLELTKERFYKVFLVNKLKLLI